LWGRIFILLADFPTGLFVPGSKAQRAPMKSARSLESCPTTQHSRNQNPAIRQHAFFTSWSGPAC
jgi:hypothetical protein